MAAELTIELLPCFICHKPCTHGLCPECYANPDPDVEIEIDESEDDDDRKNTDE